VGEIDHPHGPEGQRQPNRDEIQDGPDGEDNLNCCKRVEIRTMLICSG
jgi:hypothetical protein